MEEKIAVITGGSRGIGFATAKRFLEEGATVIITASSEASAAKGVERLKEAVPNGKAGAIAPDLSSLESVRAAFISYIGSAIFTIGKVIAHGCDNRLCT